MKMRRRSKRMCDANVLHAFARSSSFTCTVVWSRI